MRRLNQRGEVTAAFAGGAIVQREFFRILRWPRRLVIAGRHGSRGTGSTAGPVHRPLELPSAAPARDNADDAAVPLGSRTLPVGNGADLGRAVDRSSAGRLRP